MNTSSISRGIVFDTSTWLARSTSDANPRSISSRPELELRIVSKSTGCADSNAAIAAAASGDFVPGSERRIAPAPSQSSIASRNEPSGHRSPAGHTLKVAPNDAAARATAVALRRHPANTIADFAPAASATAAPFGEGRTQRSPEGASAKDAGESE